jgi:hypothetical protein
MSKLRFYYYYHLLDTASGGRTYHPYWMFKLGIPPVPAWTVDWFLRLKARLIKNAAIMTAEVLEADDIANGTVKVYGPDEMHTEAEVWRGPGMAPEGVWITRGGDWRVVRDNTPGREVDTVERNLCYCPFCKNLRRAAWREF